MREILFRGRKENGVWMYGYLFIQAEGTEYDEAYILGYLDQRDTIYDAWKCAEVVDLKTIGQFTGLKDKNGAKIFEGDIVRYRKAKRFSDSDEICNAEIIHDRVEVVKFENGKFSPTPYCDICDDYWYSHGAFDFEIVGNIHDNPELLEEYV